MRFGRQRLGSDAEDDDLSVLFFCGEFPHLLSRTPAGPVGQWGMWSPWQQTCISTPVNLFRNMSGCPGTWHLRDGGSKPYTVVLTALMDDSHFLSA